MKNDALVKTWCQKNMLPHHKRLPSGWSRYSDKENAFTQMILDQVTIPRGWSKTSYWMKRSSLCVNSAYIGMKGQDTGHVLDQFKGKRTVHEH